MKIFLNELKAVDKVGVDWRLSIALDSRIVDSIDGNFL